MTEAARGIGRLGGLVQLVRPPNVVTALGDVLAGFAVAGVPDARLLPWLLGASGCLYAGGITLNDVFDRDLDRIERPERPIPSGRVPAALAAWFGGALLAAGIGLAWRATSAAGAVAAALAALVVVYDAWGKHSRLLGPANMGLCRALNLLLGVAAAPAALAGGWPVALVPFLYIVAVTTISRGEVHGGRGRTGAIALVFLGAALAGLIVVALAAADVPVAALGLAGVLAWRVVPAFVRAHRSPAPARIGAAVRQGVISLTLLDASIGAAYAGPVYAAGMLVVAFTASALARSFAVT